jgi:AcrR family transcriptional regulator
MGEALRGRPTRDQAVVLEGRVRDAALDLFLEHGFDGTTMDAVAEAAGVTKRTLYAKYADKQALFTAVVVPALASMAWSGDVELPDDLPLKEALRRVAWNVVVNLLDPRAVKLRRLAMSEASRLPVHGSPSGTAAYEGGKRALVDVLEAHVARGEILTPDIELTADQFLAVTAGLMVNVDFGLDYEEAYLRRYVDEAVSVFVTALTARAIAAPRPAGS